MASNYQLSIDLTGDAAVVAKLDALIAKIGGLNNILSGGGTTGKQVEPIISREQVDRISTATKGISGLKKEVQSLATAAAQGFGKGTIGFLKNLSPDKLAKTLADNPDLAKAWAKMSAPASAMAASGGAAPKYKGVLWTSKEMLGNPRLPDVSMFLPSDKDRVIKGLRDVTGKDVAKVQGLGDINQFEKKIQAEKILVASLATLFNPFVGSRMLSDAIPKGGIKAGGMTGAIFGAAGAAGYGEIFVVVKSIELAFKGLMAVVRRTTQEYENARKLYAKALIGGMGLPFTAKRAAIAEILGVSETDVFRFGAQMAYLNPKLEFATKQLARMTPNLAAVAWEFGVLDKDTSALFATIANEAAPSLIKFTQAFESLIKGVTVGVGVIDKIWSVGKWLPTSLVLRNASGEFLRAGLYKLLGIKSDGGLSAVPSPQAWMKQLPASHFEKMGLVFGSGGNNYARDISRNTKEMAAGIKMIAKNMGIGKGRGMSVFDPAIATP